MQQHQHDDFVLCSLWYEDDVDSVDDSVTTEEARAALRQAASYHDAEQGINRFTLDTALDAIRE